MYFVTTIASEYLCCFCVHARAGGILKLFNCVLVVHGGALNAHSPIHYLSFWIPLPLHVVTCTCVSIHYLSFWIPLPTTTFVHVRPLYWHTCMYNICISSLFTTGTCMYTVWSYQDSQPLPFLCALHVGTHACTCILHVHVHACAF